MLTPSFDFWQVHLPAIGKPRFNQPLLNLIGDVARTITFGTDVNSVNSTDFISEIYTANVPNNAHARSFKWLATSCQGGSSILQEAQVVFDMRRPFTLGQYDENVSTSQLVKNIAMHELGHAMGLDHNPNALSVMKNTFGDGTNFGDSEHQMYHSDVKEGFRQNYGDGTTELNVAGSTWWIKSSGTNQLFKK